MSDDLIIEASVSYGDLKDVLPGGFRQPTGSVVPSPGGTTVRYHGMVEHRGGDIPPVLQLVMDVGAGVAATVIAGWIVDKLGGRASKVTINRREINLDDKGRVRRVVEEEIRQKRG